MLAETVALVNEISTLNLIMVSTSLRHQFRSHLSRLLDAQRKVLDLVVNLFRNLRLQLVQQSLLFNLLRPPIPLLRGNIGGGKNSNAGIEKEESQDFAMTWLARVGKLERLNAMLEDTGKDQKTVFAGQDLSSDLRWAHLECG